MPRQAFAFLETHLLRNTVKCLGKHLHSLRHIWEILKWINYRFLKDLLHSTVITLKGISKWRFLILRKNLFWPTRGGSLQTIISEMKETRTSWEHKNVNTNTGTCRWQIGDLSWSIYHYLKFSIGTTRAGRSQQTSKLLDSLMILITNYVQWW
jgi:hypothetical protein